MNPNLRIVFISINSLIGLALILFILRGFGASQEHLPPPIAVELTTGNTVIYHQSGNLPNGPRNLLAPLKDYEFRALPLRRTFDGQFVVFPDENLKERTGEDKFLIATPLSEVVDLKDKVTGKTIPNFKEFLALHPKEKVLFIDLVDRDPAKYKGLREILLEKMSQEKVVFMSPYVEPLEYLRRELPRSMFAVNVAQLGKMLFLNALFIETIAPLDGDIVIVPYKYRNRVLLKPRLINELKRRGVPIFLINPTADVPEQVRSEASGKLLQP